MSASAVFKRVRLGDALAEARTDRAVMARSLAFLFAFGGSLTVGSLAVASQAHLPRIAATAVLAWAASGLLLAGYDALPAWVFPAFVAGGTVLIDWSVYAGGGDAPAYAILLVCTGSYSLYFFSKLHAALQLALLLGGYCAAVALRGGVPVSAAVVTALGLLGAAGLVGLQRAHANRLIWRLADVARTDALTGLLNRRGFEELIETEFERSRRSGQPLSLIVGDLDRFKALNDGHGHASGDRALVQLALILQTVKRRIDTAARIGGEEFAVILPDSDHHAAYILAERMRREVRETFVYEPFDLTISIGVATFPIHAATSGELIGHADEALYAAKALGRDRSAVYSEELDLELSEVTGVTHPREARHAASLLALAAAVDGHEAGRAAHSQTVGRYAAAIARELGLPEDVAERVRFGGIVHDVGKIAVPESILRKPGWLTAEDWHEMRRHPEVGARILRGAELPEVGDWVHAHHERPDGTGYPAGLEGSAIPLEARILAVADAYEAMTSERVYRSALSVENARAELVRGTGSQFDGRVVEAFLRILDTSASARGLRLVK